MHQHLVIAQPLGSDRLAETTPPYDSSNKIQVANQLSILDKPTKAREHSRTASGHTVTCNGSYIFRKTLAPTPSPIAPGTLQTEKQGGDP
jgi:hypothetical protein